MCHSSLPRTSPQLPSCPYFPSSSLIPPVDHPPTVTQEMMEMAFFSPVMLHSRICSRRWKLVAESVHPLIVQSFQRLHKATSFPKHGSSSLKRYSPHLIHNAQLGAHGLQPLRQSWEEGDHALELGVRLCENGEVQRAVSPASSEEPSEPTGKAGDSSFSGEPLLQAHSSREECSPWQ